MDNIRRNKLFDACEILFGSKVDISLDFLSYIQPDGIKSAFRRVAMETHPDVVAHADDAEMFIQARRAYERLLGFIEKRDDAERVLMRGPGEMPLRGSRHRMYNVKQARSGFSFHNGTIPNRRLRFGEFLFYSGEISWNVIFKALAWQRCQRPKIGEYALNWGWAKNRHVINALKFKNMGELMGETMVRLNFCTLVQVNSILRAQSARQKPIGEYFSSNGFVYPERLDQELYQKFIEHNSQYYSSG